MKFTKHLIAILCLLTSAAAFGEPASPICLTLNSPSKWEGGLILKIIDNSDGTRSAYLQSATMFFGSVTSKVTTVTAISPITKTDGEAGTVIYSGEQGSRKLTATIGTPNQSGDLSASIDLQLGDLNISTKSASITRFRGAGKCD